MPSWRTSPGPVLARSTSSADLGHTRAFEAYYRLGLTDELAVTADLQWMRDDYRAGADDEDRDGWIFGLRFTAAF